MLINTEIFEKGYLHIAYNDESDGEFSRLLDIIEVNEEKFLFSLLGAFAATYISGVNSEDTIYLALKNGDTFTHNGVELTFKGLDYIVGHYIYYLYLYSNSETTANGELNTQVLVNSDYKRIDVYNRMVDLISEPCNEFAASLENYLKANDLEATLGKFEYKNRYVNS